MQPYSLPMKQTLGAISHRVRLIYMLLCRPLELTQQTISTHGDIALFAYLGKKYALVGNPDVLKLLTNHAQWNLNRQNSYFNKETSPAQELIPGFLQSSDGRFHRTLRTLGSTQYTPSKLPGYTRSLLTNYTEVLGGIRDTRGINLRETMKEIVYKTICNETFGIHLNSEQTKYLLKARRISSIAHQFYRVLGAHVTSWYSPLAHTYRKLYKANSKMINNSLTGTRCCPLSSNFIACLDSFNDTTRTHPLGDKQFLDDLNGYLAASESVPITVEFVLLVLLSRPRLLKKVRDEASLVFQNRKASNPNLTDLEFTRAVVLETLRLYPPFPFIEKVVTERMTINGHCIDPKTRIVVPVYSIHRDERFHELALDFLPDRWRDNSWGRDPDLRYIPFGFGHTKCIAWEQSLISISLLVARIILDFDVKLSFPLLDDNPSKIPTSFEGINLLPRYPLLLDLRRPIS